jgi:hypothetical protein
LRSGVSATAVVVSIDDGTADVVSNV